ncbi:MAG: hypothetical protein EA425_14840 [Puniceicoccaceae bacterium]|nr:MAG: hypothetical protein EA425_14840 [Puniceicoccaceae bacterium]
MKALLILGDYWHAPGAYENALGEAWQGLDIETETICFPTRFDPARLKDIDLLVLCAEGTLPKQRDRRWIDPAGETAIQAFVEAGGRLLGWHSGLVAFHPEGPLHSLYGGYFRGHPPEHLFRILDGDGREVASIDDELYRYTVPPDDAIITHWIESDEHPREPAAWTRRIGGGRVACVTLAHNRPHLRMPVVQSLLRAAAES